MKFLENSIHLNNEHIEMGTVFKAILPVAFKSSPVFSPSANQSQHQVKTISWRIFKLPKEACKKKKKVACLPDRTCSIQENSTSGYKIHIRKLWGSFITRVTSVFSTLAPGVLLLNYMNPPFFMTKFEIWGNISLLIWQTSMSNSKFPNINCWTADIRIKQYTSEHAWAEE